jgi:hypothetical protein
MSIQGNKEDNENGTDFDEKYHASGGRGFFDCHQYQYCDDDYLSSINRILFWGFFGSNTPAATLALRSWQDPDGFLPPFVRDETGAIFLLMHKDDRAKIYAKAPGSY